MEELVVNALRDLLVPSTIGLVLDYTVPPILRFLQRMERFPERKMKEPRLVIRVTPPQRLVHILPDDEVCGLCNKLFRLQMDRLQTIENADAFARQAPGFDTLNGRAQRAAICRQIGSDLTEFCTTKKHKLEQKCANSVCFVCYGDFQDFKHGGYKYETDTQFQGKRNLALGMCRVHCCVDDQESVMSLPWNDKFRL